MVHLNKEYQHAFLLEPTKFRRLVDIIQANVSENRSDGTLHSTFEVFFAGNQRAEVTELDEVLALDNSRRRRISRLAITCSKISSGARRPEQEVQVDFARPTLNSSGSNVKVVAISVRGESAWANRTLAEVEEQVERNRLIYTRPILALLGLLIVTVLFLTSQFFSFRLQESSYWQLSDADLDRVEAMLAQRPTLTDEDLREVFTMQLRSLANSRRPLSSVDASRTRVRLLFVVPLLLVIGCVVVLLFTCYPRAVFLWGDEVDRYSATGHRRKILWGTIMTVTVFGVASRLFFEGVSSFFPR
jgi:hypothetical protein